MKKILIIGAGELGSRHLQSLAKIDFEVSIEVVDLNEKSLEISKKRFNEIPTNSFVKKVVFFQSLLEVEIEFDLVIVATSSNVRLKVLKELLVDHRIIVKNFLLEKVLFQSINQLNEAMALMQIYNVNAWVNCPKRTFDSVKKIKSLCERDGPINCIVSGSNWGLLCNSIHFIDMVSFLSKSVEYELITEKLIKKIQPSKRNGFIEMFGTLEAKFKDSGNLVLICEEGDSISFTIRIETNRFLILLDEKEGTLEINHKENGLQDVLTFRQQFQSEMTSSVVRSILFQNCCELSTFEESAKLHRPYLTSLIDLYEELTSENNGLIPIT